MQENSQNLFSSFGDMKLVNEVLLDRPHFLFSHLVPAQRGSSDSPPWRLQRRAVRGKSMVAQVVDRRPQEFDLQSISSFIGALLIGGPYNAEVCCKQGETERKERNGERIAHPSFNIRLRPLNLGCHYFDFALS